MVIVAYQCSVKSLIGAKMAINRNKTIGSEEIGEYNENSAQAYQGRERCFRESCTVVQANRDAQIVTSAVRGRQKRASKVA